MFGPYTTSIPQGPATAEFNVSLPAQTTGTAIQAEVTNYTQGSYLGWQTVNPNGVSGWQTWDVNFTAPGGSNLLEFRAWWYGTVTTTIDRVRITDPRRNWTVPMDTLSWNADNPVFYHALNTTQCSSGYCWSRPWINYAGHAIYGPYTQQVRAGARTARFHLGSTVYGPFNSGGNMAIVDVYDATDGQVLATYAVTGYNFNGYNAFIYLNFFAKGTNAHEFRVYYTGVQSLDMFNIMVY